MIHRDHRRGYEASSALNQIIHREGPAEIAVGDVDTYVEKWFGDRAVLRLLEHKQADQELGRAQRVALGDLDKAIRGLGERLCPGSESGVFVLRGRLEPEIGGRRRVDFASRQVIERMDGTVALEPRVRAELWDWLNCGPNWTSREGRGRWW